MGSVVTQRDIASLETAKAGTAITALTAAGSGDNTAITGITIDRLAGSSVPLNAEIILSYTATLAATKTLTLKTVKVEDSADGTNWADFATFTDPGVVATGPTGGATLSGAVKLGVNLGAAKRYVRVDFTPDLSASGTDTAYVGAVVNLAGFDRVPAA